MTYKVSGYDPNGIPRVYGYADTEREARAQCMTAIISYIAGRPDTAPLEDWKMRDAA